MYGIVNYLLKHNSGSFYITIPPPPHIEN